MVECLADTTLYRIDPDVDIQMLETFSEID